ncbi:MAG: hypothetical protein O3C45_09060 [Bacteroidetes bacterium]|nr:hypothetical protein [Bacteroidota bacterium]MDA0875192.1 hypothetical protein [Bacteroidota bacterium]
MVLHRDFLMRQIQLLVQVLMKVLLKKEEGQPDEARSLLEEGISESFGTDLDSLLAMDRETFMALCSPASAFHADLAVALADLLREDNSPAAAERAFWLYEAALQHRAALSLPALQWVEDYRRSA